MSRTSKYTEEEKKARRAIAQARYRLKKGQMVGMPPGRPPKDGVRTVADWTPRVMDNRPKIIMPKTPLSASSSIEEIREWITNVCIALSQSENPAAWASAAMIMQRNLELLAKLTPPEKPKPEPRPRIQITIEDTDDTTNN